jgi:carboxyl-terminal processing protease
MAGGRDAASLMETLALIPVDGADATLAGHVRSSVESFRRTLQTREDLRARRWAELDRDFAAALEKAAAETDPARAALGVSDALKAVVEMVMISPERGTVLEQERVANLVRRAEATARAAEERGDWLIANELFVRLHGLFEEQGTYKADMDRLSRRLALLRLYVPDRLWELRNARQIAAGEKPLPPYNPIADSFADKLRTVDRNLVMQSIARYSRHVDQPQLGRLLIGGLEAVDTLVTTRDLTKVFPGLGDAQALARFRAFLETARAQLSAPGAASDFGTMESLLARLSELNTQTIAIPDQAILHEFGNGAMASLDEFTAIIWPDELARFDRITQGRFPGVGIRIEYDELFNIRVVTPLEGRPADRAGVKAGDIIKKVNGRSIFGATLDQAVEMITGPVNTPVTLTMERADQDNQRREIEFTIVRAQIDVPSAQGWRRIGAAEDAWDWFIDPVARVGYVRLSGFSEKTDAEFGRALAQMQDEGLNALIIDLRHNPGGLLDQAVRIVGRFIGRGEVVLMQGAGGQLGDPQIATGRATITGVPVAVLVNEGSASASEIVSGALQHYAARSGIPVRVVGQRTFGKGSVQNVYSLAGGTAKLKLTTQYYALPNGRIIHRRPGDRTWGVEPDVKVDMLPQQIADSITLRRNADVWHDPAAPRPVGKDNSAADPSDLLSKGMDPQLHAALVLVQSQTLAKDSGQATIRTP